MCVMLNPDFWEIMHDMNYNRLGIDECTSETLECVIMDDVTTFLWLKIIHDI